MKTEVKVIKAVVEEEEKVCVFDEENTKKLEALGFKHTNNEGQYSNGVTGVYVYAEPNNGFSITFGARLYYEPEEGEEVKIPSIETMQEQCDKHMKIAREVYKILCN